MYDNPQVQMLPYQEDWADNTTVTGMSDLMVPTKPLNTGDQVNIKSSKPINHHKSIISRPPMIGLTQKISCQFNQI